MKILVFDEDRLASQGICAALRSSPGFEVVGEADTPADLFALVRQTNPDVVLLDVPTPPFDALVCLERLQSQHQPIKVVVLSTLSDPSHVEMALSRGACGYIVKKIDPHDLAAAIRQAAEGTTFHVVGAFPNPYESLAKAAGLTDREITVLKAVTRGLSNHAISTELWVSQQTVKFHLTNLYRKLGVANRTEAARYAYEHGLVDEVRVEAVGTLSEAVTQLSEDSQAAELPELPAYLRAKYGLPEEAIREISDFTGWLTTRTAGARGPT
jgi:DNA-binding NarL/FixJ family response regulator